MSMSTHRENLKWGLICGMAPRLMIMMGCIAISNIVGSVYERLTMTEYVPYHYIWSSFGFVIGGMCFFMYGIWTSNLEDSGDGYE